jgi:hypothetical protein
LIRKLCERESVITKGRALNASKTLKKYAEEKFTKFNPLHNNYLL